jgi:hypothetical protein
LGFAAAFDVSELCLIVCADTIEVIARTAEAVNAAMITERMGLSSQNKLFPNSKEIGRFQGASWLTPMRTLTGKNKH